MSGYFTNTRKYAKSYTQKQVYNGSIPSLGIIDRSTTDSVTSFRSGGVVDSKTLSGQQILANSLSNNNFSDSFDNGHTFSTLSHKFVCSHPSVHVANPSGSTYIDGPLLVNINGLSTAYPVINNTDLTVYGTRAINATIPTKPTASLTEILGSLLTGQEIPAWFGADFIEGHVKRARLAGGEYLNYQFGWVPFVNDIIGLFNAVTKSAKIIAQFERDNGQPVRRKLQFPKERTSTSKNLTRSAGFATGAYGVALGSQGFNYTEETSQTRHLWFSGEYIYHLATGNSLASKFVRYAEEANKLLGLKLTPEILWDLTPWSWLADWFVDLNSYIGNASLLMSDGLVIKYGYLMCTTVAHITSTTQAGNLYFSNSNFKYKGSIFDSYISIKKERIKATPFGFGLVPSNFNAGQWLILGALGLTHSEKVLAN